MLYLKRLAHSRQDAMIFTSIISAFINIILSFLKIIIGILGHSQALIVDGIHSLSDLISDVIVWLTAKFGYQPADEDHPYGHARIETAFTVGLGLLLIMAAGFMIIHAIQQLFSHKSIPIPAFSTLFITVFSIIIKEILYQYTIYYGRLHQSRILIANAWHHRSDSISSIIVLIGIVGSLIGWTFLDGLAAIFVALMIIRIGWQQIIPSFKELIDTGLNQESLQKLYETAQHTEGINNIHSIRSRSMGEKYLIDLHLEVNRCLTVSEAHQIGYHFKYRVLQENQYIEDVFFHIDIENDQIIELNPELPLRKEIRQTLRPLWQEILTPYTLHNFSLNYHNNHIDITVCLPFEAYSSREDNQIRINQLRIKAQHLNYINQIDIHYVY